MLMKLSTMAEQSGETLKQSKLKRLMVVRSTGRLLISVLMNIDKASNTF